MITELFKNENYEIIIKNNYLYIKNYINIFDISMFKICVCIKNKKLYINGKDLIIFKMDKYDLGIKGIIKGIEIIDE